MLKATIALVCLMFALPVQAKIFAPKQAPTVNLSRAVMVDGVIMGRSLRPLGDKIVKLALENAELPIDIIVDSPGGSVIVGTWFINQMEAARGRGAQLRCFVSGAAASMAFSILLHCDERYALTQTYLLWHPVRVSGGGGGLTARESRILARSMAALDKWILKDVAAALPNVPYKTIKYHFQVESLHYARNLQKLDPDFMEVYDYIPGLYEALSSPDLLKSEPPPFFFGRSMFKRGTIIYMQE